MPPIGSSMKFIVIAVCSLPPLARGARPEIDSSVRSFPVGSYVVFYRETNGGIEVARVLHGRRDLQSFFRS